MKDDAGLIFDAAAIREKGGLTVKRTLAPAFFSGLFGAHGEVAAAAADLVFSVGGESILLEGAVQATLRMDCARCGSTFMAEFSETFDEVYEDAVQSIDVGPSLSESIALMMPLKPLCAPECRGLCRTCGGNLNRKACGCAAEDEARAEKNGKENPFKALKDVIKKKRAR